MQVENLSLDDRKYWKLNANYTATQASEQPLVDGHCSKVFRRFHEAWEPGAREGHKAAAAAEGGGLAAQSA